jgi:nitrogen fixation/metabolism regulation signal transduction histidine kinase
MTAEATFYILGSIFFILHFLLLIVLIVGALLILHKLRKLQSAAEERLEKRSVMLNALPYLPMILLETIRWWKRR